MKGGDFERRQALTIVLSNSILSLLPLFCSSFLRLRKVCFCRILSSIYFVQVACFFILCIISIFFTLSHGYLLSHHPPLTICTKSILFQPQLELYFKLDLSY